MYGVGAYRVLVGKLEGKRLPGITRSRWQDDIKMDFKESFWKGVGWLRIGTSGGAFISTDRIKTSFSLKSRFHCEVTTVKSNLCFRSLGVSAQQKRVHIIVAEAERRQWVNC